MDSEDSVQISVEPCDFDSMNKLLAHGLSYSYYEKEVGTSAMYIVLSYSEKRYTNKQITREMLDKHEVLIDIPT